MISGIIRKMRTLNYIMLTVTFLFVGFSWLHAQDNETLAKSYFLQAEEAYEQQNYANAEKYLDKVLEYLGNTNPRVEALYIRTFIAKKKYLKAEQHLNTYFEKADEQHSAYNEMLKKLASVKEKRIEQDQNNSKLRQLQENLIYRITDRIENYSREDFAKKVTRSFRFTYSWYDDEYDGNRPSVVFDLDESFDIRNDTPYENFDDKSETHFNYEVKRGSGGGQYIVDDWEFNTIRCVIGEKKVLSSYSYEITYYVKDVWTNSRFTYFGLDGREKNKTDKILSEFKNSILEKKLR